MTALSRRVVAGGFAGDGVADADGSAGGDDDPGTRGAHLRVGKGDVRWETTTSSFFTRRAPAS